MTEQRRLLFVSSYYIFYFYHRKYGKDKKGRQMYASKLWQDHHDNVFIILIPNSSTHIIGEIDTVRCIKRHGRRMFFNFLLTFGLFF